MGIEIRNAEDLPDNGYPFCLYFKTTNGLYRTHTFIPVVMLHDWVKPRGRMSAKLGRDIIPKYDLGNLNISALVFYTTDDAFKHAKVGRNATALTMVQAVKKITEINDKNKRLSLIERLKPENWETIQSLL